MSTELTFEQRADNETGNMLLSGTMNDDHKAAAAGFVFKGIAADPVTGGEVHVFEKCDLETFQGKTTELPFGIQVSVENGTGCLGSDLAKKGVLWESDDTASHRAKSKGFADGIEGLLLALACAGVKVDTPVFAAAINTAVEGFVNNN